MLVFDDKTPNATYDDFVPYTGDGETLTHDVAEINSNLDSQGLLNKFDGKLEQGYKNASGTIVWDSTNVCIKNTISVSSGDKVTVKLDSVATRLYATYRNNGVFVSEEINYNTNNVTVTIPSGANGLDITMVYDSTTTPSQVGNLYVYINNAIAELKNDLSTKIYELAGSELYLCVSGKSCVLTLNGYNLTGSTNFSKLAEYPPYLVARNVVAKEDGVCIFSVDPNGNIGASDLQVASSVTGKMFGEVSWVANI